MNIYKKAYLEGKNLALYQGLNKLAEPIMAREPDTAPTPQASSPSTAPQEQPTDYSFSDALNSAGNYLGDAYYKYVQPTVNQNLNYINDAYTNYVRPALNRAMEEIPPEQSQGQRAPAQAQAQVPAQATPSTEQPSNGTAASGSGGFGLTLDPTMQNLRASYDFNNTPAQAPAQAPAAQQAQPQEQAPSFNYTALDRDGMPDPYARFNVQAGNYRKQFNRFREQYGSGQDGAFEGLTYKDFAGALGNRGLRVGDSLNANDIMTRLQRIREDNYARQQGEPFASSGAGMDALEIQNRRGNLVNRGSLAAMQQRIQRAGAARPAVGNQPMRSVASPMANTGRMSMPSSLPSSADYGNAGTTGTDGGQSEYQKYVQSGKSYPGGR
jgi:hypothetical protein